MPQISGGFYRAVEPIPPETTHTMLCGCWTITCFDCRETADSRSSRFSRNDSISMGESSRGRWSEMAVDGWISKKIDLGLGALEERLCWKQ